MKVSIAIATYNGEKFISEQLDSILAQTLQPDEVIIIDDCSTDNTASVVKDYIAQHNLNWSFSVAENNSGYKRNFYNCLQKCTGDIVFLCDQDDVWYKDKLKSVVSIFEKDSKCLAVNTSFDMTDAKGEVIVPFGVASKTSNHKLIKFPIAKGEITSIELETVLVYNISPGCTCAFKREIVQEYLSTSNCLMPHDWELNIIAAAKNGLRFYNLPFIGYRQHGNNAIGLSEDESFGPIKMRGTVDVRFKVFEMQKAQCELVNKYCNANSKKQVNFLNALNGFCKNREKILYEKKVLPCFKNLLLYSKLKNVSTIHFRGLIGDLVYCFKK